MITGTYSLIFFSAFQQTNGDNIRIVVKTVSKHNIPVQRTEISWFAKPRRLGDSRTRPCHMTTDRYLVEPISIFLIYIRRKRNKHANKGAEFNRVIMRL